MLTRQLDLEDQINYLKRRTPQHPLHGRAYIEYRAGKIFRRGIVQCLIGEDYLFVSIHDSNSDDTGKAALVSFKEVVNGHWDFYFDTDKCAKIAPIWSPKN